MADCLNVELGSHMSCIHQEIILENTEQRLCIPLEENTNMWIIRSTLLMSVLPGILTLFICIL